MHPSCSVLSFKINGILHCTTFLQRDDVKIVSVAVRRLEEHPMLWHRYLKDFEIQKHLITSECEEDILEQYLSPLMKESDILLRLISLHAHVNVHQIKLARVARLLRSLGYLHPPERSSKYLIQPMKSSNQIIGRGEDFAIFLINNLYTVIKDICCEEEFNEEHFNTWFKSYLEMVRIGYE